MGISSAIDGSFEALERLVGVPSDFLKLVFAFFLSYPLAHIFIRLLPPAREVDTTKPEVSLEDVMGNGHRHGHSHGHSHGHQKHKNASGSKVQSNVSTPFTSRPSSPIFGNGAATPSSTSISTSAQKTTTTMATTMSNSKSGPLTPPWFPHVYSILVSTFYMIGLFKMYFGFIQLVIDCVLVWGIVQLGVGTRKATAAELAEEEKEAQRAEEETNGQEDASRIPPNSRSRSSPLLIRGQGWMPWLVFFIIMGHLTANHIYRNIANLSTDIIEITGPQMVLTMKLIMFAWNVEDGRTPVRLLDDVQRANRLTKLPDLLEFMGYCLFFPSMMIGPANDYASYAALIRGTLFTFPPPSTSSSALATSKNSSRVSQHKLPRAPSRRKTIGYSKLLTGVLFMAVFAVTEGTYNYPAILDKSWYEKSIFGKFLFTQIAGFVARTKYYGAWSLTEGACILTGIGFNGYDPKTHRTLWNRVTNIDIIGIETSESFKVLFDSWNCRANVWLRETVYKRVTPRGKKPGTASTLLTFFTSAFWHGVDIGYYLAFITGGFCTSLGRPIRHLVRPFFLSNPVLKRSYDFLGWLIVHACLNYLVAAFFILSWTDCITAWHRLGWYGHVLIFGAYAFFKFGGKKWLIKANVKAGRIPPPKKVASSGRKEI